MSKGKSKWYPVLLTATGIAVAGTAYWYFVWRPKKAGKITPADETGSGGGGGGITSDASSQKVSSTTATTTGSINQPKVVPKVVPGVAPTFSQLQVSKISGAFKKPQSSII